MVTGVLWELPPSWGLVSESRDLHQFGGDRVALGLPWFFWTGDWLVNGTTILEEHEVSRSKV